VYVREARGDIGAYAATRHFLSQRALAERFAGRTASGGALALEPTRATILFGGFFHWARGKRRNFRPGASRAPEESDQSFHAFCLRSDVSHHSFLRSDIAMSDNCRTTIVVRSQKKNRKTCDLKKDGEHKMSNLFKREQKLCSISQKISKNCPISKKIGENVTKIGTDVNRKTAKLISIE